MKSLIWGALCALLVSPYLHASTLRALPQSWEEELKGFNLPAGFTIDLVASEEDGLVKPIDLTFDDAGRLWTQTASMYPMDSTTGSDVSKERRSLKEVLDLYQGKVRGTDRILIVPDPHKKVPSKPIVWADGLAIPQSTLPYKNGAYVAQGSELFLLEDTDGDGRADKRVRLLTGFGVSDSHTLVHTLVRAPGGWIHFSQGALNKGEVTSLVSGAKLRVDFSKIVRMSMDGAKLNIVTSGLNNIWGFQLRANGQWYGTEANDNGWSLVPMEEGTGFSGIGGERIRPYQPWIAPLHDFRVGGTGISGLAFVEDASGSFPAEWRDLALLANPITSAINAVKIVRNADGSVSAKLLPDFVTSNDKWFRPVNMEFGPDGCLYVADWYNKVIAHNEEPLDHPDRDKTRGRIWRICHESQKAREIPNLYQVSNGALIAHLQSPSLWEKRAAWHQIVDRKATELAARLVTVAGDASLDQTTRIHALWSLEGLNKYSEALMSALLKSPEDELRREAVRALGSFSLSPKVMARHAALVKDDGNVMVRSQLLRTLGEAGKANAALVDILVSACRPELPGTVLGGPYERKFERYLARMALEGYPEELSAYLKTQPAASQPVSHLFWATQALRQPERDKQFLALWPQMRKQALGQADFGVVAQSLNNPEIVEAVRPFFDDVQNARLIAGFANGTSASAQSRQLAQLLRSPLRWLLGRDDKALVSLGVEVAAKFDVPDLRDDLVRVIRSNGVDDKTTSLVVTALASQPGDNRAVLSEILTRKGASFAVKTQVLTSLSKVDTEAARKRIATELKSLDSMQKRSLVSELSRTPASSGVLLALLKTRNLTEDDFDLMTARRLIRQAPQNEQALSLCAAIEQREALRKEATQKKVEHLARVAARGRGNPSAGKPFFDAVCLACHAVGGKGAGFAPALDGSAHRENEALLTSIFDPDAAIENAYLLFSVVRSDGSVAEGYLKSYDQRGTTLQFMGGGEVFIDRADIQNQFYNPGRSVMPAGLMDSMSDEQVEDVLAYIRTLQ